MPKRQKYFECFLEFYKVDLNLPEPKRKEIIGLARVRWVERYKDYGTYNLLYKATVFTFASIEKRNLYDEFYNYLEEKYNNKTGLKIHKLKQKSKDCLMQESRLNIFHISQVVLDIISLER